MMNAFRYYRRLFKIYRHFKKGHTEVSTLPARMWVELNSGCNLECVMCPNKDLPGSRQGLMEREMFKRVVDEAAGFVFDLTLHHRGESLLHPEAVELITYAAGKIGSTNLHTNGTVLDEEMAAGLVASGLKRISFSFDGFENGDYEKIRVGADFDAVVDNIKNLLRIRNRSEKKYPRVAIEVIELNRSQVQKEKKEKFIGEFKRLGLDELVIKKPHNWAGYIPKNFQKKQYSPCTFLWNALLVLWDGDVVPCAQDFFGLQVIGNLKESTLRETWNAPPIRDLRQGLIDKRYGDFPACKDCDRLWRDTVLGIPREFLKRILLHKMT